MPAAWASALDAAIKDGKIPKIPWTTQADGGDPTYPDGTDPNSPEVCSSTYQCRTADSVWDGPAGYFGISFDDGPLPVCLPQLLPSSLADTCFASSLTLSLTSSRRRARRQHTL
jgi:hypothetical protein